MKYICVGVQRTKELLLSSARGIEEERWALGNLEAIENAKEGEKRKTCLNARDSGLESTIDPDQFH